MNTTHISKIYWAAVGALALTAAVSVYWALSLSAQVAYQGQVLGQVVNFLSTEQPAI